MVNGNRTHAAAAYLGKGRHVRRQVDNRLLRDAGSSGLHVPSKGFGWKAQDVALGLRRDDAGISKSLQRSTNPAYFDRAIRDADKAFKDTLKLPNGIFKTLPAKTRDGRRRNARKRRKKVGELQIRAFEMKVQKFIDENPISHCDCSPFQDFITGMKEKTSNEFMSWFEDVMNHSRKMEEIYKFLVSSVLRSDSTMGMSKHVRFLECVRERAFGHQAGDESTKGPEGASSRAGETLDQFNEALVKFESFIHSAEKQALTRPVDYAICTQPGKLYHDYEEL